MAARELFRSCRPLSRREGLFLPLSLLVHGAAIVGLVVISVAPEELTIAPHTVVRFPGPDVVHADSTIPPKSSHAGGGSSGSRPRSRPIPLEEPSSIHADPDRAIDEAIQSTVAAPCDTCGGPGPGPEIPRPGIGPESSGSGEGPRTVRVSEVRPPRKIHDVKPVYPPIARAAHLEGIVVIECTIGVDGRVTALQVLQGASPLTSAATDAVSQWVYAPTLLDGVPVAVIMTVTVNFVLPR